MRNAFVEELISAAEKRDNIVLMVGDLGYGVVEPFATRFPDRFFNAGVAEQNMMGMAAGLASEGYHVFVYSIANFPTFRCAEQIRNDVDYHNLSVTIVAVGGGVSYGNLGYSHHAIQDYALMRGLPNMLIAAPGDPMETRACVRYLIHNPQPSYLRLGKAGETSFHMTVPPIEPGKWLPVLRGDKTETILTTGTALETGTKWVNEDPKFEGFSLCSMPLWGMASKDMQKIEVNSWTQVVTIEDHLLDGGFGGWLLESLVMAPELLVRIQPHALGSHVCGMVAKQNVLMDLGMR